MQVRDVMTEKVVSVKPSATLATLDRALLAAGVSGAPVVHEDLLVGVVSRSDVVRAVYEDQVDAQRISGFYHSPFPISLPALDALARESHKLADRLASLCVRDVMSPAVSIGPDESVEAAAALMCREGFHRLPVVEAKRLVGIITSLDMTKLVSQLGLGRS